MNTTHMPLVGISGRRLPGTRMPAIEPRYQQRDFDMFFSDYSRQVAAAGGLPVQLSYDADPHAVLERLDALLVTGGQDISPYRWGGEPHDAEGDVDDHRDRYESQLIEAAIEREVPLLGICRGMQLINVVRGGSLIADLPQSPIDHRGTGGPVDALIHPVDFTRGSVANSIYGARTLVNSLHHQGVDRPGRGVVVTGQAEDGVPECIEIPGSTVLAMQWHPEWMPHTDAAFRWLVNAATAKTASLA